MVRYCRFFKLKWNIFENTPEHNKAVYMTANNINPKVDFFFEKAGKWQKETEALRTIVLKCGLTEELKWGCPCYTYEGTNVVLIHHFKEYCALLFMKGVLLQDTEGILIQQTENVQAARQIRFANLPQIVKLQPALTHYIYEAVETEKAGLKVSLKQTTEFSMPAEFEQQLAKNDALKTAFYALTPGRQRGYLLYFSAPKQSKTRVSRIENSVHDILNGKGLQD